MSEQYLSVLKRQSEINGNCVEIREKGGRNFSNEELRFMDELAKEYRSNRALLIKLGVIDHEYFTKKRYGQVLAIINQLKIDYEELRKQDSAKKEDSLFALNQKILELVEYLDETYIEMRDEKRKILHVRKNRMHFLWQIISELKTEVSSWSIKLKLTLGELEFEVQNISAEINDQIKERDTNKMEAVGKIENLPSLPKIEVPTFGGGAKYGTSFKNCMWN